MKEYLQLTEDERKELENNFLREPDAFYELAEMNQLRDSLRRSYKERFLMMTTLMKLNKLFSKAKITRNDSPLSKPE